MCTSSAEAGNFTRCLVYNSKSQAAQSIRALSFPVPWCCKVQSFVGIPMRHTLAATRKQRSSASWTRSPFLLGSLLQLFIFWARTFWEGAAFSWDQLASCGCTSSRAQRAQRSNPQAMPPMLSQRSSQRRDSSHKEVLPAATVSSMLCSTSASSTLRIWA